MPLRDHFRPPLHPRHHWESFLSNWATRLADGLTDVAPDEFMVEEHRHVGPRTGIDIASFDPATGYVPPDPTGTIAAIFPDEFEVRVFNTFGGKKLVAAIELISPGNKDRPAERRAFAAKCASYLARGVSLVLMDIVTTRRANLHNETMRLMEAAIDAYLADGVNLYAVAYRPVLRGERPKIDIWTETLALGQPLPTMPLRLTGDLFVPVDFEAAYQEACRRRRLI